MKLLKIAQGAVHEVVAGDVKFEVGNTYEDAAGKYIVDSISDDLQKMKVTYTSGRFAGEKREYSPSLKAGHYVYILRRHDDENAMRTTIIQGDKESWALGYLASYGKITADVPPEQKVDFEKMYKRLTGDTAQNYLGKEYYVTNPGKKWNVELRIRFPEPPPAFVKQFEALGEKVLMGGGGMEINSNNFIKNLFKWGFMLGQNERNLQTISTKIPQLDMKAFIDGATTL